MVKGDAGSVNELIDRLGEFGSLRVWSVIITVFGDSVMPRGGVVSASALSAIVDRLPIRAEALRVALHRLAKDGWIIRRRTGRNSHYALSENGRTRFLPASLRIYAREPSLSGPWRIVALKEPWHPETKMSEAGFLQLSPTLFLAPQQAGQLPAGAEAVIGDLYHLPNWARAVLAPEPLWRDYSRLHSVLSEQMNAFKTAVEEAEAPDAVALRTMLVHHWRRLLLRHADLPEEVMPMNWPGEECRSMVLTLYKALSRNADPWLDNAIGPRDGPVHGHHGVEAICIKA